MKKRLAAPGRTKCPKGPHRMGQACDDLRGQSLTSQNGFSTKRLLTTVVLAGAVAVGAAACDPQAPVAPPQPLAPGQIDTSFASNGRLTPGGGVLELSDGRIVVSRNPLDDAAQRMTPSLTRYNPNGSIDATYGTDGTWVGTPNNPNCAQFNFFTSAVDTKDRVLAVDPCADWNITRYAKDGGLDASFGTNGVANLDGWSVWDLKVNSNGTIAAVATKNVKQSSAVDYRTALLTVNESGNIAATREYAVGSFRPQILRANGSDVIVAQSEQLSLSRTELRVIRFGAIAYDKRIADPMGGRFIGTYGKYGFRDVYGVERWNLDAGTVDTSFGINGRKQIGTPEYRFISVDSKGRFSLSRREDQAGSRWTVARYTADLELDATFGVNGSVDLGAGGSQRPLITVEAKSQTSAFLASGDQIVKIAY